ncbi:SRPBCC domain-containing protein [Flavobacterium sp.]|uniref:SRPBCC domain-containing protein n=1 Tax=Flavobacterium sp. TaxID=239 RepID=UPI00375328F5
MITVETTINASIEKVWDYWTNTNHIVNWNNASDDWYCPKASNNLIVGGKFNFQMASKDGKISFDFEGEYSKIEKFLIIEYSIIDGRKVNINFKKEKNNIIITQSFEAENENSEELQRNGWQNILDNFKKYTEQ